jgi:hypothetical protein
LGTWRLTVEQDRVFPGEIEVGKDGKGGKGGKGVELLRSREE